MTCTELHQTTNMLAIPFGSSPVGIQRESCGKKSPHHQGGFLHTTFSLILLHHLGSIIRRTCCAWLLFFKFFFQNIIVVKSHLAKRNKSGFKTYTGLGRADPAGGVHKQPSPARWIKLDPTVFYKHRPLLWTQTEKLHHFTSNARTHPLSVKKQQLSFCSLALKVCYKNK